MDGRGLCECGCGRPTTVADGTDRRRGWIKGQPLRFVVGHNNRSCGQEFILDTRTGCWVWQLSINNKGYGRIRVAGREMRAHRYVYEKHKGAIPDGFVLDHLCRNTRCVNPDHLEAVTQAENLRRSVSTKYSVEVVQQVRALHATGLGYRKLSRLLGMPRSTIEGMANRRCWADV